MSGSADRALAARLLVRVEGGDFAAPLLERVPGGAVRTRVLGVLRWRALLDEALGRHLRRPLDRLDPEVRAVLRIGVLEAAVVGVPAPVAVDGAVHAVRAVGKGSASGLVNAVLRRAVRTAEGLRRDGPPWVRLSHPRWLVERWIRAFGEGRALGALEADQEPAGLWAWFADGAPSGLRRHPWVAGAVAPDGDPGTVLEAVRAGRAFVQDPASQLVAHLAADLAADGAGPVADLCAAPGGKSALLARRLSGRRGVALDLHVSRTRFVRRRLAGAGDAPWLGVAADGRRPPLAPGSVPFVLLDAPCSGTGTLRRHPEIRWRLSPDDLPGFARLQRELLRSAAGLLAPGGTVLYTTCSLEPEENEDVVEAVAREEGLEPVALDGMVPEGAGAVRAGTAGVRLLPGPDNDGFTLHALRRTDGSPGAGS